MDGTARGEKGARASQMTDSATSFVERIDQIF